MTIEEIKSSAPEVFAQIEAQAIASVKDEIVATAKAEAIKAERERIAEIMQIADRILDKELIQNALFGENPMDAKTLAFEAMKRNKSVAENVLKSIKADAGTQGEDNSPNAVVGAPKASEPEPTAPKSREQQIAEAKAMFESAKNS